MASVTLTNAGINWSDSQTPTSAGSTQSEILDSYEEGVWTPTSAVGTLSAHHAVYTKVGRLVQISSRLTFGSTSNSTTQTVNGFPFTSYSGAYGAGSVGYSAYTAKALKITIFGDVSSMSLYAHDSTGGLNAAALNSKRIDFTIHYII